MNKELRILNEDDATELVSTDDFDVVGEDDVSEKIKLLAQELDVSPFDIEQESEVTFKVTDGDGNESTYHIFTEEEADIEFRDSLENLLHDCGPKDLGIDVREYLDENYCQQKMDNYNYEYAYDLNINDLIDELFFLGVLTNEDLHDTSKFVLRDDVDTEDEDFDDEDIDNYECVLDQDELAEMYKDYFTHIDSIDWFLEYYNDMIEENIRSSLRNDGEFPEWLDVESMLSDMESTFDRGVELAQYDNDELYLGETSSGDDLYAYRID